MILLLNGQEFSIIKQEMKFLIDKDIDICLKWKWIELINHGWNIKKIMDISKISNNFLCQLSNDLYNILYINILINLLINLIDKFNW